MQPPCHNYCIIGTYYDWKYRLCLFIHQSIDCLSFLVSLQKSTSPCIKCGRCRTTLGDAITEEVLDSMELSWDMVNAVQIYKHSICVKDKPLFRYRGTTI